MLPIKIIKVGFIVRFDEYFEIPLLEILIAQDGRIIIKQKRLWGRPQPKGITNSPKCLEDRHEFGCN